MNRSVSRHLRAVAVCAGLGSLALLAGTHSPAQGSGGIFRLPGHVPSTSFVRQALGPVGAQEPVSLALVLPLRNRGELQDLLGKLYDPQDPEYGHFLTTEEFADRFSPTEAQYRQVAAYAQAQGLTVTGVHPNRLVLDVSGPAASVEQAFSTRLQRFQSRTGQVFRAPAVEPGLPAELAGSVAGVVGLDDLSHRRPHSQLISADVSARANPYQTGSGPGGGLTPANIKAAYNLAGSSLTGAGQTLALYELDGYRASDITAYESAYGLPNVPLQNVLVDGYSGAAGSGAGEVTLDIELQIALAPGVSKILVYEGPNGGAGVIDTYNRIATDNLAKSVSTSWGLAETLASSSERGAENQIFQQMAAQGQSIFAASGDSGAYDDGSTLTVDDPASQPYVTGVGGTHLATTSAGGPWKSETTWNAGSANAGGGGGGISKYWSLPSYQTGVVSSASQGSTTMRNVPDVSLDSDPNTGYSIYYNGRWALYGGTSCAAPLWSAFTALVNQTRAAAGSAALGFANPSLYQLGKGSRGAVDFHDIADGSTNLYYPAVIGYDCATGWGSFNGANLLPDLSGSSNTGGGTGGTGGGTGGTGGGTGGTGGTDPNQLLGNPGFENGASNPSPWVVSSGVIDSTANAPAHGGSWKAWMNGYGQTHTDSLAQTVTVPNRIKGATLTFWTYIATQETGNRAVDKLTIQIRNTRGGVLGTLATYSNLNRSNGYVQRSFNLYKYRGQTIQLVLTGTEDSARATSFLVDDFALTVK